MLPAFESFPDIDYLQYVHKVLEGPVPPGSTLGSMAEFSEIFGFEDEGRLKRMPSQDITLTPRENQILNLIAVEGMGYKEVAERLGLSHGHVKNYAKNLHSKLGLAESHEHSHPLLQMAVWYWKKRCAEMSVTQ